MYKQIIGPGNIVVSDMILRVADNAYIPFDEANTDYQAFLAWIAEGNAPLPPDEPPVETP
jgi:hypothetical protein